MDPIGVGFFEFGLLPSPNRQRDSIVLSRLPFKPFKTLAFLLLSGKPISFSAINLASSALSVSAMVAPKTCDCLFGGGGVEGTWNAFSSVGSMGRFFLSCFESGYAEDVARNPKPNSRPFFTGRRGGESLDNLKGSSSSLGGGFGLPSPRLRS